MKILKFYAPWCVPCKTLSAMMERMKDDIPFEVEEINVDDSDLGNKFKVRALPTLVIVDGDTEVKRRGGLMSIPELKEFFIVQNPS
jgi:thioredoxin 1